MDRREVLRQSLWGLAAGASSLWLAEAASATESSGALAPEERAMLIADAPAGVAAPLDIPPAPSSGPAQPTEDNILGPYYRANAPFRGKITPPLEPGTPLVVRGRVWAADTRRPLKGALLDIWQANDQGRYDNDDADSPPKPGVFLYRARLMTDETGYYEYETVRPGRYQIGPNQWRPAHIHYMARAAGYTSLVTQMYFDGDPMNKADRFIKPSLIITPTARKVVAGSYQLGTFDVVLAPATAKPKPS